MIIQTKDFVLRPMQLSDAANIAKLANNRRISRNTLAMPYPYKLTDAKAWLRRSIKEAQAKDCDFVRFAIEINEQLVGCIELREIEWPKAELGYWLGQPYWGKGIMTKVVKEVANYGFKQFGLRRIQAKVFTFNPASKRVLEKAGFKLEGILKKDVAKNNKLLDNYLLAKVK